MNIRISAFCRPLTACLTILLVAPIPAQAAHPLDSQAVLRSLTDANDRLIEQALNRPGGQPGSHGGSGRGGGGGGARGSGALIMTMAAAYANPLSKLHHDPRLIPAMTQQVETLRQSQTPSGLWSMGNLNSPPDSAFVLKTLAKGQLFLVKDGHADTAAFRAKLKELILSCTEGVRKGGVHTVNHRWAVCTALAHVNQLYPDERYLQRIEEWLAEGQDIDADGQWSERSSNYTSDVNNPSMVELAVLLKRPALLDAVRRSLDASVYFFEPNGEVETVASRRQDQRPGSRKYVWEWYFPYRYLATLDGNGTYAAVARWIEHEFLKEMGDEAANMSSPLTVMLEFPEMSRALPADQPLQSEYAKVFPLSSLARIKRGAFTATLFGGSDWYQGVGHASGLSTNPTFFKLRKGAVILDSVRMAPTFLATGFFFSEGLKAKNGGYTLWQDLDVPYFLPLPAEHRRADGLYPSEGDMGKDEPARFYATMGFSKRPRQYVSLNSKVTLRPVKEGFELGFDIKGEPGVPFTVELVFRPGGTFSGLESYVESDSGPARGGRGSAESQPRSTSGAYLLKDGFATYTVGADRIEFGPGFYARPPTRMEGNSVSWVSGSLRVEGERVFLTGVTPFRHTLTFK